MTSRVQGMRDFMRGSLARSLSTLSAEDRLAAALPLVCGTAMAGHCVIERLDDKQTLHIRVSDHEWLGPLLAMRDMLRSDLARTAGVPLGGLHFEVGRQKLAQAANLAKNPLPLTFAKSRSRFAR